MIISGGENIWPAPIERIICCHPAIVDVAVVGRSDPDWGQVVTALLVLEAGATMPSLEELRDLVRAELPAYCAPRHIVRVERISRTTSGKIVRSELGDGV
jgi:acyl-CoA synthetase (AMP-forming)/AMP-acid ligase II